MSEQQGEAPPASQVDIEELSMFMRREFGSGWRNILEDKLKKTRIKNLFSAPLMAKRFFIEEVLNMLETYSSQKKQVLRSELNQILQVRAVRKSDAARIKTTHTLFDLPLQQIREDLLAALLGRILKQEHRVEVIYHAFWAKATRSLREDVDIKEVFSKMNKALRTLKQDVDQLFSYYKTETGISDDLYSFVRDSPQRISHFSGFAEYEKRVQVAQLIYQTQQTIDPWYDAFIFFFLSTLQQEIKRHEQSPLLVAADDGRGKEIWEQIRQRFSVAHEMVNGRIQYYRIHST